MARKRTMEQLLEREKKLREQIAKQKAEDDRRIARIVRKYLDVDDLEQLEKDIREFSDWLYGDTDEEEGEEPEKDEQGPHAASNVPAPLNHQGEVPVTYENDSPEVDLGWPKAPSIGASQTGNGPKQA